jgi:hypothetical protein
VATPPKKPLPEGNEVKTYVINDLVAALLEAPNPRIAGGSPAYWQWYDNVRKKALEQVEQQ